MSSGEIQFSPGMYGGPRRKRFLADIASTRSAFLWISIQIIALTAAALDVPPATRMPRPVHAHAIEIMLAAQLAMSSLLFPIVLRNVKASVIAFATSWTFLHFAATLSNVSVAGEIAAAIYVTLWLAILATIRLQWRDERSQLIWIALISCFTLGSVVIGYVGAEFGTRDSVAAGPIAAAIMQARQPWTNIASWIFPLVLLLPHLTGWVLRVWTRSRATPPA